MLTNTLLMIFLSQASRRSGSGTRDRPCSLSVAGRGETCCSAVRPILSGGAMKHLQIAALTVWFAVLAYGQENTRSLKFHLSVDGTSFSLLPTADSTWLPAYAS